MTLSFSVRTTFTAPGAEPFTVDASLSVPEGETLVVLGPSGSGKTLLLETVAGFHPHEGRVAFGDETLTDRPPEARDFGFVFQDYALFPHMTVRENVAFGSRYHEETRDPDQLLEALGVSHLAERTPRTLSGGEAQRVALARALAIRPRALLLDEPLSALDAPTRESLRDDLADVLAEVTAVYVTHNRTTARALADRVAVMRDGRVVQSGSVEDVFDRPTSAFVASFTGANTLPAVALNGDTRDGATVAVRPEYVDLVDVGAGDVDARVTRTVREDATNRVSLVLDGHETELRAFTDRTPAVGDRVGISVPASRRISLDEGE